MSGRGTFPSWHSHACHRRRAAAGFTMLEVMVSLGLSGAVIGMLLASAMALNRALNSSKIYADAYSDQRRVTDYIARDLRRGIGLAVTDSSGVRTEVAGTPATVLIADRGTLIITLPAYYRSNGREDPSYEVPLEVVAGLQRLDYGTSAGVSPPVEVSYRRIFFGKENCVCFLRQEAGKEEVIVRHAENLFVEVSVAEDAQTSGIKTWFRSSALGPAPLVSTYDRLLLRNPPLNYRP